MTPFFISLHTTFHVGRSMFHVLLLLIVLTLTTRTAQAQPPAPADNPSNLINLPAGKFLWWYGYTGRTYFIQVSDIDNPLGKWNWAPIIEAGNNAPISYEVDGTASKKFFRLKPTDLPIPAGKTIDTADFDQDGISNIDEINPPPPLSASDATDPLNPDNDDDGMSDIWEKSFAVSLLALGKPAAYWGANYAALVSGTLDSDTDYTGEGITAGELAAYGALPAAQQPADGIHKQSQGKRNILAWGVHRPANDGQPELNEGLYFYTNDGFYGDSYDITAKTQLTPAYLAQQVLLNPWGEGGDSLSSFRTTSSANSISYSGEIRVARTRSLRLKPELTAVTKNFLKTTGRSGNVSGANPTYEVEAVTLEIPAGKLLSQWVELSPPVIENSEHRADLISAEVTVAFGLGPEPLGDKNSRKLLEEYLETIKVSRTGDTWFVKFTGAQGLEKFYGIEIVTTKEKLITALKRTGQNVVFDGHSNFGLGPNFSGKVTHKTIGDFTRFGVGKTSIPKSLRGAGTETDVVPFTNGDGTTLPTNPQDLAAIDRLYSEGWAYLKLEPGQIITAPQNYQVTELGIERFKNLQGVGPGSVFTKQGNGLNSEWHFENPEGERRLIVQSSSTDVPTLGYAKFFYNACNTGRDYIESFNHGDFIYTKDSCRVEKATTIFVRGIVEGKTIDQIMADLNQNGVGNAGNQSPQIYGYKTF